MNTTSSSSAPEIGGHTPPLAKSVHDLLVRKGELLFTHDDAAAQEAASNLKLFPDVRRALFLAEKMRADFVYNAAALEGNPFTFPEVKTLLDGITVGGHKIADAEQVLNLNRSLSHVIGLVKAGQFRVDASTACAVNGIVARDEALEWGVFRSGQVSIGGTDYLPPSASDLPFIFDIGQKRLNTEADPVLRAFLVFLWGSLNQFFYDGNKRTSRLLASGTLMSAGFPPLMIQAKDQLAYNQIMTRFYDNQEATEALAWLYAYYGERVIGFGFHKPA